MKRPLILLGLAVMGVAMVRSGAGKPKREFLLQTSLERLSDAAREGAGRVTLTGIVQECGAVSKGTQFSINQISILQNDNSEQTLTRQHKIIFTTEETRQEKQKKEEGSSGGEEKSGPKLWAAWEHGGLEPGDQVFLSGSIQSFEPAGNPGQFDRREYYHGQNIVCVLEKPELLGVKRGRTSVKSLLYRARALLRDSSLRIFSEEEAKTVSAVALGEKSWMDGEVKNLYQESGIAHIVSVSGLHVSLVGMGLYELLRRFLLGIVSSGCLAGGTVILYTILTGGSVSAVRACVMFLIWLLAQGAGRKYDRISAAFAAAAVILAGMPGMVTNSSFLLSFGAVFSIAVLVPVLEEEIRGRGPLVFSLGLWLGMLPITLYFFYQTPVWTVLLNLLVVPLMPFVMGLGLLGSLAGMVCVPLGMFLAAPVHYILKLFELLCRLELQLPGNLWVAGRPSVTVICLYYGVIFLTALLCRGRWRISRKRLLWAACVCLCLSLLKSSPPRDMEILCLDVGQGDSTLLRMPTGEVFLVDGGSSSESQVWTYRISQVLKYYGERSLDGIFLSHGDADHINGIEEYLEDYQRGLDGKNIHGITCRRLILPPTASEEDFAKLEALARKNGIEVIRLEAGNVLERGPGDDRNQGKGWSFTCLSPTASALTGDKNQDSMVLLFQYGSFRMMFTGDLEGEAERSLVRSGADLRADVLKVGHHGSKNGSSEEFLLAVRPSIALISCGLNNRYGHPAAQTLERLEAVGCAIYETDQTGAAELKTEGRGFIEITVFSAKT